MEPVMAEDEDSDLSQGDSSPAESPQPVERGVGLDQRDSDYKYCCTFFVASDTY